MAELINKEKIRGELVPTLSGLLDETLGAASKAGCSLEAVVLFGSAVGGGFVPKKSDVNIFMVFDKIGVGLLRELRTVFNRHFKKLRARPVVVDTEFVKNSTDVFPMEFFEWKDRSLVIYGENPLIDIEISQENLRLQIEENLRGKRMRLMQAFFEMDPRRKQLQPFLEETLPNFVTVLRNILRMLGEDPNLDAIGVIDAVEGKSDVSLKSLRRLQSMKTDGGKIDSKELETLFGGYVEELDALTRFTDSFEVG